MEEENKFEGKIQPNEEADDSDASSGSENVDSCPICLLAFTSNQEIGKPAICDHKFCFTCIQEWSKVVQTCPIDRTTFKEIRVYGNLECDNLLRTVVVEKTVGLDDLALDDEVTPCEICGSISREDMMLLCDGCDKGFHMDCLTPPLLQIPSGNWFCADCFESSDSSSYEIDEIGNIYNPDLMRARLRFLGQPQITRTTQSERIRNAIISRMSLRSARESFGEGPSTSTARQPTTRRRTTYRRRTTRRRKTVVVEYGLDGSDKFAMKTRRVATRKGRKKRKKVIRRVPTMRHQEENIVPGQMDRALGTPRFNLFESANLLDYIPDEDGDVVDSGIDDNASASVLTQGIINFSNPLRRSMIIKNRVLQNCTATSNAVNLLDSIMEDQSLFASGSIQNRFAVDSSSGKLLFVGKKLASATQTSGGGDEGGSSSGDQPQPNPSRNSDTTGNQLPLAPSESAQSSHPAEINSNFNEPDQSLNTQPEVLTSSHQDLMVEKKKKPKKPAFDMFDENSNQETNDDCPNFSIYDSVDEPDDQDLSNRLPTKPSAYDEENVDLVQMSDNDHHNESSNDAPPAIVASQPASPDLENDKVGESMPERSYTPPIMQKTQDDAPDKDDHDKKKREKDSMRGRKRELERYNVRDRLKERSPVKVKDKFGRNRSRSRSSPRRKPTKRRSRSISKDRYRKSRSRERKSKTPRSYSRSRSRRRTPSMEFNRKRRTHKEKVSRRRSRSRSYTSRHQRPQTPERRDRSRSKKAKRKKHRDESKEKPSTSRKEVFTSGQNILVSVNFNNQEGKSLPKRLKSHDREEPKEIVDITAKKKITVSSKPVAIIDLARSPFRELTPEYQSNVIELSDSDGEKTSDKKAPKSPDSTLSSKLYDPFEILNSPTNENVTSSQTNAAQMMQLLKPQEKIPEPPKNNLTYNKNVMALATSSNFFFNEENLVSSSSSLQTNDKHSQLAKLDLHSNEKSKPMDMAESPYSPGHDYDSFEMDDVHATAKSPKTKQLGIFDELFGSSTPPGLDRLRTNKKSGDGSDPNKYLNKLKRQERVIEEVKLIIKPFYSKRIITKEQYKEILRKAVPKICHSREINPQKIKILIDSYVKIFKHRKKRSANEEIL